MEKGPRKGANTGNKRRARGPCLTLIDLLRLSQIYQNIL